MGRAVGLSDFSALRPPPRYVKKEYLGAGAWKVAFRASSPAFSVDIALLCYHGDDTKAIAEDVSKLVRLKDQKSEYSRYITRVHDIHFDDDDRVWIAEELLTEPLAALSPLAETRTFCEIARDLSRALTFIHSKGLVHRDMKLDNCGVDVDARITKIFDIGSITSEHSSKVCTILTRAPKFFLSDSKTATFTKADDIWALGATLFALRTGRYPFVTSEEAQERSKLGERLATGEIDRTGYKDLKKALDAKISHRARADDAEETLFREIERHWSEGALRLMKEMLSFKPSKVDGKGDADANYFQQGWSVIAGDFIKPASPQHAVSPQQAICDFLRAVETGDLVATPAQIEKCGRRLEKSKKVMSVKEYDAAAKLVRRAKRKMEGFWKREYSTAA